MITMYGISNCDTIKKARRWLNDNNITFLFHDYRKDGLTEAQLTQWTDTLGWESLLNKRGTTWRNLPKAVRDNLNHSSAITLMLEYPAIIKRPLLAADKQLHLGFHANQWLQLLLR